MGVGRDQSRLAACREDVQPDSLCYHTQTQGMCHKQDGSADDCPVDPGDTLGSTRTKDRGEL